MPTTTTSNATTTRQRVHQSLGEILQSLKEKREEVGKDGQGLTEEEVGVMVEQVMDVAGRAEEGVDEPGWKKEARRNMLDRGLEKMLLDMVLEQPVENDTPYELLCDILDVILTFSEREYADVSLPLTSLSSLFDLVTLAGCEKLFTYIERRRDRLLEGMQPQRGKGPILLRLLNELLRRLPKSKTEYVVFSGRILMFLSSAFPLGEKSGVNLRGNFNVGKETVFDNNVEEGENEDGGMEVEEGAEPEEDFYSMFWSLQRIFTNPPILFSSSASASASTSSSPPTDFPTLRKSLSRVLEKFAVETKRERELLGARREGEGGGGGGGEAESEEDVLEHYFFPKFLTSKGLLELELADASFRRQILVQTLILFQYLLSFTEAQRAKAALILTNASAQLPHVLATEIEKWILDMKAKALGELDSMEGGVKFRHTVEVILARDQNWINWKFRNCPSFGKPSIDAPQTPAVKVSSASARTKLAALGRKQKGYMNALGNPKLSALWGRWNTTSLETCKADSRSNTDVVALIEDCLRLQRTMGAKKKQRDALKATTPPPATLQDKLAALDQEIENLDIRSQALHWRALRAASTTYLHKFHRIGDGNLEKLLKEINDENAPSPPPPPPGIEESTAARPGEGDGVEGEEKAGGEEDVQVEVEMGEEGVGEVPAGEEEEMKSKPLPVTGEASDKAAGKEPVEGIAEEPPTALPSDLGEPVQHPSPKRPREEDGDVAMEEGAAKKAKNDESPVVEI